jgi:transcriptional regulator with XRE-family HTH domain
MSTRNKAKYGLKDLDKRLGKMTIGSFLRAWRFSEELSQKEFAKKLGLSPANVCDIEKGRKGVSPERAAGIAKILGYSPTVLVRLAIEEQLLAAGLKYDVELKPAA